MGFSCSWIAVQGAAKAALLEELSLAPTGEAVFPGTRSAFMSCAEFPNDWVVLFSEDFDWADRQRILELSRFGLAIGCQGEDRVMMTSVVSAAKNGVELWRVFHDNEKSIYRLDITGEPPAELAAIRDRLVREQEDHGGQDARVDFVHEAPFELARAVCGYRHDEDETAFMGLKRADTAPPVERREKLSLLDKLLAPLRPRAFD